MKDQFLKLAGVKSEKEFYKLFPDEATFMDKYGKEVNKILRKGGIVKAQPGIQTTIAQSPFQTRTYDITGGQGDLRQAAANSINANIIQNRRNNLVQGFDTSGVQSGMNQSGKMQNLLSDIKPKDIETGVAYASAIGGAANAIGSAMREKGREKDTFKSLQALNPLITQAASSSRERIEREYLRPDDPDFLIQPDTLHNPLGTGPGLYAKNGGEIANTFAPNTIYTDLEQAKVGADVVIEGIKTAGDLGAFFFDMGAKKYQKKNEQLMGQMGMQPGIQGLQSPYVSHMKQGGFINPQVATSLEGIPMKKLFSPDTTMNTLRTGGNIRQNNISAMDGNIKATWGGQLQPISYNPYQAGSGQTVLGFGNYHDQKDGDGRTGIGLSVGNKNSNPIMDYAEYGTKAAEENSNVEIEPKEPIIEQRNLDGGTSVVVLGNQKLTRETAKIMGDPKLAGKKINTVGLDIAMKERNINNKMQRSAAFLAELNANNPYDKLTQSGLKASFEGYNRQLQTLADDKLKLTAIQDKINELDESGVDYKKYIDKGEVIKNTNKAKMGGKITTAQKGKTISQEEYDEAMKLYNSGKIKEFQELGMKLMPEYVKSLGVPTISKRFDDGIDDKRTKALVQEMSKSVRDPLPDLSGFKVDVPSMSNTGNIGDAVNTALDYFRTENAEPFQENYPNVTPRNKNWLLNAFNQAVRPYLLPSDTEGLAIEQVAPEYMALAQNQVEPVQAQKVPLRLMSPQQVSYADQLAQVQSDYRAAQRLAQINPAATSNLAAQKYAATRNILGEEFRANQAMRDAVQAANYAAMAQNDLLNLQQLDQQYVRQQQAIANTKAVKQAAINSINAKILQNRLANRQLGITENLYNYRFDEKGRAINVNPLMAFNTEMDIPVYDNEGNIVEYKRQVKEKIDKSGLPAGKEVTTETRQKPTTAKNGTLVKAVK